MGNAQVASGRNRVLVEQHLTCHPIRTARTARTISTEPTPPFSCCGNDSRCRVRGRGPRCTSGTGAPTLSPRVSVTDASIRSARQEDFRKESGMPARSANKYGNSIQRVGSYPNYPHPAVSLGAHYDPAPCGGMTTAVNSWHCLTRVVVSGGTRHRSTAPAAPSVSLLHACAWPHVTPDTRCRWEISKQIFGHCRRWISHRGGLHSCWGRILCRRWARLRFLWTAVLAIPPCVPYLLAS